MLEMACAHCGKKRMRATGEVNRARRSGKPLYCSRQCGNAARTARKKESAWHKLRFEPHAGAIKTACGECKRPMWLPPSKVAAYKRCGPECNRQWRERTKKVVVIRGRPVPLERQCETCGTTFRPRPIQVRNGAGRYCCRRCIPAEHLVTPEALAIAQQARREAQAAGLIEWKSGAEHHSWKGGQKAALARRVASGKAKEALRRYRKANPDKVREFTARRASRKLGKLPYGTLPRIRQLQNNRCAICRKSIARASHVDHILPLARGGKHEPTNIQLLCPPCNLAKSDRDPIQHMQSLGRLL